MQRYDFEQKLDSMLPELMERIRQEARRLYSSGSIDIEKYGDDYQLPKICLYVALNNEADHYIYLDNKREIANLKHF